MWESIMAISKRGATFGSRLVKALAASAILAAAFLVVSASAESKARIVRLSEVQGTVQIDRIAGEGFSKAFINLPVIEGSRVKTGNDGRAEVEFEDGSTLRLAPGSEVDFVHLALGDNGSKLNTVQLVSGTVYANLHLKKARENSGDQFALNFDRDSVTIADAAHFRLDLDAPNKATLAVFKGKCSATLPSAQFDVTEKHSATIKFAKSDSPSEVSASDDSAKHDAKNAKNNDVKDDKDTFVIAKNFEAEPSDAWDRQQTEYHDRNASTAATASLASPYAYGISDLNYYGNFMNLPGYGNVWQPFFIGANWSPFQDGGWAFYPGSGYMWVSGYPWGWMPYRYGNWAFANGVGWFWQPGFAESYYATPRVLNAPASSKIPTPPATGQQTVMVGRGLAANPPAGTMRVLTINPGSAGFGVPRGSIDHLNHIAKKMDRTSRPATVATAAPTTMTSGSPSVFGTSSSGSASSSASSSRMGGPSPAPMGATTHHSSAPTSHPH
jgi:hypothetical protein